MKRKLIDSNENEISVFQIIGFIMIGIGILTLFGFLIFAIFSNIYKVDGDSMAIMFFIIMTGIAFAFPTLLQDHNEGLSTMRIVVFMVVNVICILLLKIGWGKENFTDIGIDQYWVGIIAFVFGAKATQSFFESKMAIATAQASLNTQVIEKYSQSEIAKKGVEQYEEKLKAEFPNIKSVSDAVHDLNQTETHVIAIYLKDQNDTGIPKKLNIEMSKTAVVSMSTEIIKGGGVGKIQFSQAESNISDSLNPKYSGSICCAVRSTKDPKFLGVVTSAHIITHGRYDESNNDIPNPSIPGSVLIDGSQAGTWFYKLLSYNQDLAVIKLDEDQGPSEKFKYFSNQYYQITDKDIKPEKPNVTIISKDNRIRDAYILDYAIGTDVEYESGPVYKKNIILIGSTNDRNTSTPVSLPGDSGSCVFKKDTNQLIGMLLGGDEIFTFVLPINKTLQSINLNTL
jgi:hypothetical protein